MAHSICTPEGDSELAYVQRLWRTLLAPNIDPRDRLEQLFEHETVEFDLKFAFLSRIDLENESQRFEVAHGPHEMLKPGTTIPLPETYCRRTIADPEGTLAVSDALAEGWGGDPAYEAFGLESYLGTTISVDNVLYGTLCFADTAGRDEPIRDEEKTIVEIHGQWVEYILTLGPPLRETRVDTIEGRAVSSDAIDSMMGALESRTRRVILMTLLGAPTEISIDTLERRVNDENARIRLLHSELPRLANAGYIRWDEDAETVATGPRFSEVEPLVQLLKEYHTAFSE